VERPSFVVLVLLLLTALAFAPGLAADFVWDDWSLIVRNGFIRDPGQLGDVLKSPFWRISSAEEPSNSTYANVYRPVVAAAYVAQFQLFGDEPLGYHVVSLLLHLACAALAVLWITRRLAPDADERGMPMWIAATVGAGLFALHPTRPENVTWVSGSTDLWMAFFWLLGLVVLQPARRHPASARLVLGGACLFLAALSKEVAVLAPVLLVTDDLLLRGRRVAWRPVMAAAAGVGASVVTHLIFVPPVTGGGSAPAGSPVLRVLASLGHYAERALWPLSPSVQPAELRFGPEHEPLYAAWAIAAGAAVLALVAGLGLAAARRRRVQPYLADVLWIVVPLAPVMNILPIASTTLVAERFLYVPLLGLGALVARAVYPFFARGGVARTATFAAAALVLVGLASKTVARTEHFLSDSALWTHELEVHPNSLVASEHLAEILAAEHRYDEALALLKRAHRLARERGLAFHAHMAGLHALEVVLATTSDADQPTLRAIRDAYADFAAEGRLSVDTERLAFELSTPSDELRRRLVSIVDAFRLPWATARARTLQLDAAEAQLEAILEDAPLSAAAHHLLGIVRARQGEWEAAARAMARAHERLPDHPKIVALRRTLEEARQLAERPAPTAVARALRDARVQTLLGAPEAARRILAPQLADHPTRTELVMARARADVADQRFDLARAVLEAAQHADPARDGMWAQALENLERAEAESAARREARGGAANPQLAPSR
jgi:tetratricopeptide (TPR) repeat protein